MQNKKQKAKKQFFQLQLDYRVHEILVQINVLVSMTGELEN